MVKDIDTASIMAGYHAVMVQLHERAGKAMHADKPEILMRVTLRLHGSSVHN